VDDDSGHYRRYTIQSLSEFCPRPVLRWNLRLIFFAAMVAPIFFLRHIPSRLGLRKSREVEGYANELARVYCLDEQSIDSDAEARTVHSWDEKSLWSGVVALLSPNQEPQVERT